jgi:pimeloyl-ACP methyl ester carboxylesterase
MRCLTFFLSTVVVVVAAVLFGRFFGAPRAPPEWHKGAKWERFLSIYDTFLNEFFADCDWQVIDTSFGSTALWACGDRTAPAVLFLHGAASSSMIYGDWILPRVAKTRFAVAVDFVCDVGRSRPVNGDVKTCPQTEAALAQWVREICIGLGIDTPVSLVGYSYGAFIAAATAIHEPALVDRVVLLAPAAVLAPVEFGWLWRAIVYGTFYAGPWFTEYMAADPNFVYERDVGTARHRAFLEAVNAVSATVLAVPPSQFDDETLRRAAASHKMLVVIGDAETVTNATLVAETARRTGIEVELVRNAGHLMLIEKPARHFVDDRVPRWLIAHK